MGIDHSGAAMAPVSNGEAMKPAARWRKCNRILGREAQGEAGTPDELEGGPLAAWGTQEATCLRVSVYGL